MNTPTANHGGNSNNHNHKEQVPEVHPSRVLDARDGFLLYLQRHEPDPEALFEWLVQHDYVTLKFYVEMSSGYGD